MPVSRTWTLAEIIAFYREHGAMPFPISGGDQTGDDDQNDDDKGDDKSGKGDKDGENKEDLTALKDALRKERELRGNESKRVKTLEKQITDLQTTGKTEAEKLALRLEALEADNKAKSDRLRDRDAESIVTKAATKAGAPDADVVYRYLRSDIQFDDDGKPTNIAELIKDLREDKPSLFKKTAGPADAGGGNGNSNKAESGDFMRSALTSRRGSGG